MIIEQRTYARGLIEAVLERWSGLGYYRRAANLHRLLEGSAIIESHRWCDKVQDAYSLRCAPQVAGAARDTLAHVEAVAERELAAVIDNPVVLADQRVESNGNFHGAPLAHACDFLAIVSADLGCSTRHAPTGCRPSSPPIPASTPG